ncbi:MAG: alpha/beta hydrolase [Pseudomonadota bacterium]
MAMQRLAAFIALVQILAVSALGFVAMPSSAQQTIGQRTVTTTSWVEEWDPQSQSWVRVDEASEAVRPSAAVAPAARRAPSQFAARPRPHGLSMPSTLGRQLSPVAQYGPFIVLDEARTALVGSTDSASPRHFEAMLRDFPAMSVLEMIEAPGTSNDIANLAVGRLIRANRIATHVPNGGSVRSGAVELFLAGVDRTMEPGAQFAVHSWLDNYGREPDDFAPDAPANRLYLDYYIEMGMSEARAKAFYAMTNSVPHDSAKWLGAWDMEEWISPERIGAPASAQPLPATTPALIQPPRHQAPRIAYADLDSLTITWSSAWPAQAFLDS